MTWQELLTQHIIEELGTTEFQTFGAATDKILDLLGLEVNPRSVREFTCETWCDCGVKSYYVIESKDES